MNRKPPYRTLVRVWLALMVFLALTCASAFVDMGTWNTVANFTIAVLKAMLVAAFFMHLIEGRRVHVVVATAGMFILTLMLGLTLADYSTRAHHAAAWEAPPRGDSGR
jgi:cytochrome c oxidase subunit 4